MLLGNGFLPMFAVAVGGGLVGATWALDGSGRAYNVPTLGAELLANGDMELDSSWSNFATPTTNERSTAQVRSGTYSRRWVSDAVGDGILSSNFTMTSGTLYQLSGWLFSASLAITVTRNNGSVAEFTRTMTPASAWTNFVQSIRAVDTGINAIRIQASTAGAANEHFADDFSMRSMSMPATLATIAGTASNQTAAARIHTLTSGTQAGIVSLLDSASNPQNGLFAYHDGTGVTLDKVVNGTWTNLVPRVTVAFSSLAQVEIRRPSGNTIQLWYNGVQRGTNQTVADASIISNTIYGLFSTFSGNLLSEFSLDGAVIPFGF